MTQFFKCNIYKTNVVTVLTLNSSRDNTSAVVANGNVPTQLADSDLIVRKTMKHKVTFNDIPALLEAKVENCNSSIGKMTTIFDLQPNIEFKVVKLTLFMNSMMRNCRLNNAMKIASNKLCHFSNTKN